MQILHIGFAIIIVVFTSILLYTIKVRGEKQMTILVANTFGWLGFTGLANWFKKMSIELQARSLANATIKELSALTDKDLNDIGIARGDIRGLAQKHYEEVKANANLKGWV